MSTELTSFLSRFNTPEQKQCLLHYINQIKEIEQNYLKHKEFKEYDHVKPKPFKELPIQHDITLDDNKELEMYSQEILDAIYDSPPKDDSHRELKRFKSYE